MGKAGMNGRRVLAMAALGALSLVAGCMSAKPPGPVVDQPRVIGSRSIKPPPAGQCDAPRLAWLVGRSRNEIPVPLDPTRRRVACTQCPVTEDFKPERTTILYDAQSGLVTAVRCG
jgi:hypothetical protein